LRGDSHGSHVHRASGRSALTGIHRSTRLAASADRLVDPADRGPSVCRVEGG